MRTESLPLRGDRWQLARMHGVVAHRNHIERTLEQRARFNACAAGLYDALKRLVESPDLNLDELEPATRDALAQAHAALAKAEGGANG